LAFGWSAVYHDVETERGKFGVQSDVIGVADCDQLCETARCQSTSGVQTKHGLIQHNLQLPIAKAPSLTGSKVEAGKISEARH
jgi:hypothetical protein